MKILFASVLFFAMAGLLHAADPVKFTVGGFTFERPEGWSWIVPSSPMRKAQLAVTAPGGAEPADVTFFYFGPGRGGGVQANVARWLGQFQDATSDVKTEKIGKTNVTFVQAAGTFSSGMPGRPLTPKPGYALRGAIMESQKGDVFVKMTGPEALVKSADAGFDTMIRTAASR